MGAAWQMTIDMKLGLFAEDSEIQDPLAASESNPIKPSPPFVQAHNIWIEVCDFANVMYKSFSLR